MVPNRSWGDFLAPVPPKPWNHWFSSRRTDYSCVSWPHFGTYCSSLCDQKIASWTASAAIGSLSAASGSPSADALLCTLLAKVRTTYRSALTKCAQITHIVPPVTVQLFAMWLSMHLIQNCFSLGTSFSSLCDPKWQLGRHPRLSRRLHPHFSLNNCRGFAPPYVYSDLSHGMLWVAGGICFSNNHCNRYRGTRL